MKKVIISLVLCVISCMDVFGQSDDMFVSCLSNGIDTLKFKTELAYSGKCLRTSAKCDYAAIAFACIGAGVIVGTQQADNNSTKNVGYAIGGVCGLAAIIFKFEAISYKFKSGKVLEYYGNGIRLRF